MKKIAALLLAVSMIAGIGCLTAGCDETSEKGQVCYLNARPEADEAWQALASQYTEQTGVEVQVITPAAGTYTDVLANKISKGEAPTLFQCRNAEDLKDLSDYCLDLTETDLLKEMTTEDLNLVDENGAVKAIGYCYEAFGIIVNKKLLTKAGYQMADITDFDSLKLVAEDIHARAGELGFDAFAAPCLDHSSSWIFSGPLANMPSYYHLANIPLSHEFRDDNISKQPVAIKGTYLAAYKNIWDLYINNASTAPSELITVTPEMNHDEFGTGKAVFWQQGTWEYNKLIAEPYSMNPEDLQMIPIYCGIDGEENAALCCGTEDHWAVNAQASELDRQATLDFLQWVVTSDVGTAIMAEQFGSIPFRAAKAPANVFYADSEQLITDEKYVVTWAFDYTPDEDQWSIGLLTALTDYSVGNGDWEAVETAFVDGWAAQFSTQDG